jgi:hypothetical protein
MVAAATMDNRYQQVNRQRSTGRRSRRTRRCWPTAASSGCARGEQAATTATNKPDTEDAVAANRELVERILAEAERVDEAEDVAYGQGVRG